MRKEITLYFDQHQELSVEFYNYDYDHEYPSQTIDIRAKTVKIVYCKENLEQRCYMTNVTSIELVDHSDDIIYHAVSLFENNKIRIITEPLLTIIEIY